MKNNKKDESKSYSVIVFDWINGALTKIQNFFPTLEQAKSFVQKQTGDVKIYNSEHKIIHSEKKEVKYAKIKKDKPGKDKDDDDYN